MTENRPNRLAKETSTYLKGASHQPVDWYPWGEEAFRRAKELDRPILLDIGATWCHWCHVIDRESYEDPDLAKTINDHFVAVKVDRDERPDIDARYQQAVGAIAGQGGWPLTGFLTIVTRTLTSMAQGGVYDQVGGGFHRYSTDPRWIVPHFEKMLYDNAGLLANYVHAWQLTKDPLYRETAEGILTWVDEVLSDRERGGYYASQDADVGLDDDGDYFTWTLEELNAAVNPEEARVLALLYEVGERGEMHHNPRKNVLFIDQGPEAIGKALGLPVDRVRSLIASGRRKLKAVRDTRTMPAVDKTIFASWNGMMIAAVLEAAMAFDREDLRTFALKSLYRIRTEMWSKEQGMWHASVDGEQKVRGLLEDHVYLVDALLAAFHATADPAHLGAADEMMTFVLKHFWDPAGGFVDLAADLHAGDGIPLREIRRHPFEDSPYAGANPVAALCLQRLHALTGKDEYRLRHDELLSSFAGQASRYGPVFAGTYHLAAELWVHAPPEVVILGARTSPKVQFLRAAALETFAPGKTVLVVDKEDAYVPALIGSMRNTKEAKAGPVAFVCEGTVCSRPTSDVDRLRDLLAGTPPRVG